MDTRHPSLVPGSGLTGKVAWADQLRRLRGTATSPERNSLLPGWNRDTGTQFSFSGLSLLVSILDIKVVRA